MLTLYRLISFYDALPLDDTYHTAASCLLMNLRRIPEMSIDELAEACYASPTTLNRLVRRIGCASFTDFRRDIREALTSYDLQVYKMSGSDVLRDPTPEAFFNATTESYNVLAKSITVEQLDAICHAMHAARSVRFYADIRDCSISPDKRQLQLDLITDGKDTAFISDPDDCLNDAKALGSDSLVIIPCSTYMPSLKCALALMKEAKSHGAVVVAIVEKNAPHVSEYADHLIEYTETIHTIDGHLVDWIACLLSLRYSRDRR